MGMKYQGSGPLKEYGDVYRVFAIPAVDDTRAPTLFVEYDERSAIVTTERQLRGKVTSANTNAVPLEAVDALVAAWLEARPIEVAQARCEMANAALDRASAAEQKAWDAFVASGTGTLEERGAAHAAYNEAQDAEQDAINRADAAKSAYLALTQ